MLDQFDKSIKRYIRMFEAAGLLGPPSLVKSLKTVQNSLKIIWNTKSS